MILYKPALFSKEQIKHWVTKHAHLLQQFTQHFVKAIKIYSVNYKEDEKALAEYTLVCVDGEQFTYRFGSFESFVEKLFQEVTVRTEQWGTFSSPFRALTTDSLFHLHPLFIKFCRWWINYALELKKDAFDNFYGFKFTKIPVEIQKVYGCRLCAWHFGSRQELAKHYIEIHRRDAKTGLLLENFGRLRSDLYFYAQRCVKIITKPAEAFPGFYIKYWRDNDNDDTVLTIPYYCEKEWEKEAAKNFQNIVAEILRQSGFVESDWGVWVK
jgi:hypothetical protein